MPRSGQQARERLQQAALELYATQGFDQTTTAEIAQRADVTERTFFRHFLDKREVLFDGQAVVRDLLVAAVDDAEVGLGPLEALRAACLSIETRLEQTREFTQPRYEVIAATSALRERELSKLASLADALAEALERRGIPAQRAALAARAGVAAFNVAVIAWYDGEAHSVRTFIDHAFDDLQALTSAHRT